MTGTEFEKLFDLGCISTEDFSRLAFTFSDLPCPLLLLTSLTLG